VAARIGGATVFPGVVVARGLLLGAIDVGVVFVNGAAGVIGAAAALLAAGAAGVPNRRSRASSMDRPMF
jgi:hypothetical protein